MSLSLCQRTGEMVITARAMLTSIGSSRPARRRVSAIEVSTGPRIRSTASASDMPSTGSLSMWVITSPAWMPARCAGVSSIGETTLTRPSSIVTSMPRPPNSPLVCTCMSRYFLASR